MRVLADLRGRVEGKLGEPGTQVSLFVWAYRAGLVMLLSGYAVIGYYLWKGGFLG